MVKLCRYQAQYNMENLKGGEFFLKINKNSWAEVSNSHHFVTAARKQCLL